MSDVCVAANQLGNATPTSIVYSPSTHAKHSVYILTTFK